MIPQHESVLRRLSGEEFALIDLVRSLDAQGLEMVLHFASAALARQLTSLPNNVIPIRRK